VYITKLQMREAYCIAFPQTARLPDSCARLSLPFSFSLFLFYGRHTSEQRGFRHKWISLAQWSLVLTFLLHHLDNVFKRNFLRLIFLVYSCLFP